EWELYWVRRRMWGMAELRRLERGKWMRGGRRVKGKGMVMGKVEEGMREGVRVGERWVVERRAEEMVGVMVGEVE
uniref:hypothetical protein n=1 Tax=Agrococcus jejuensis TaxID=399736 RepID=UPI001642D75A